MKIQFAVFVLLFCARLGMASSQEINILLPATTVSLDPSIILDQSSLWVSRQLNCQLFRQSGRNVINEVAQSYEYTSPTTLVVSIRSDVKFSDGTKLTPDDVVSSLLNLKKKRKVLRNVLRWIKDVRVVNKSKVKFELTNIVPQFQKFLTSGHYAILPKKFNQEAVKNQALWQKPIGCGNFKVVSTDDKKVTLKALKGDRVINFWFRTAAESRGFDSFDIVPAVGPSQFVLSEKFRTEKIFDPYQLMLALNTKVAPWNNLQDRCALFSSFDSSALLKVLGAEYVEASQLIPRGVLGFSEKDSWPEFYRSKKSPVPKLERSFCSTYLSVSVSPSQQPIFNTWLQASYPQTSTRTMESVKTFGSDFSQSGCDSLFFGFKSNNLDGYEYLLIFGEDVANPTAFKNDKLKADIAASQDLSDNTQRAGVYESIVNRVRDLCLIYPLATIPYKKIFVRKEMATPKLGEVTLDEYDLTLIP